MARGYWRVFVTLVGLVCLGVTSYAAYQVYYAADQRRADYEYQPSSDARFPEGTAEQLLPGGYQPNCRQPQTPGDAELCAQWAAVTQATESNRIASFSLRLSIGALIFTIVGTGLLVWTLWETRATARRELRAYVSVRVEAVNVAVVEGTGLALTFDIISHNGGATPAYDCVHFGTTSAFAGDFAEKDLAKPKPIDRDDLKGGAVIHSGEDFPVEMGTPQLVPFSVIEDIKSGQLSLYTYGVCSYLDTFGVRRRTDYCYTLGGKIFADALAGSMAGESAPTRVKWKVTPYHNSAT